MASKTIHSLEWYLRKMKAEEKRCRKLRHIWPLDNINGTGDLPAGVRVTGQVWEGSYRLRVTEYCDSCGSEAVSFRHGNGHYDIDGPPRRIVYGPDHVTVPIEVSVSPRLIKEAEDSDKVARLFVKAAGRGE